MPENRQLPRVRWAARSRALCALLGMGPAVTIAADCATTQFRDTRVTVCKVDLRAEHLQLFLYDAAGKPFNSFQRLAQSLAARNEQLTFAMNAGMFREDSSPVGLMVQGSRQIHRINLASGFGNFYLKPNGVFLLSASGARIVETTEYRSLAEPAQLATQSGPLLVKDGQVSPALNPQGTSRLIRNGVCTVTPDRIAFAISEEPVTFYDFALLFRDQLKCRDALYLDGNVSSLYSRSLGRDDAHTPLGPIFAVTVTPVEVRRQ